MALEKTPSPCHQGLTPPDSPTKGLDTPQATLKDLNHLFDVLGRVLPSLTYQGPPNTPVSKDHSQPGPDMVQLKQLLVQLIHDASVRSILATGTSNWQEGDVQAADEVDLNQLICTTPGDFKSFEKWASIPQFKTVAEMYGPSTEPLCLRFFLIFEG